MDLRITCGCMVGSVRRLSIAATIAAAHRGRADVATPPGGGADVWIEVPAPT